MKPLPCLSKLERGLLTVAASAAVLLGAGTAHATVIATDANVPATMNQGGTVSNPAEYIIGSVSGSPETVTHTSTSLGSTKAYNYLTIQNGWTLMSNTLSYVGSFYSGTSTGDQGIYNKVTVTGAGSTWTVGATGVQTLNLGRVGAYNQVIVSNNGTLNVTGGYLRLGSEGGVSNSAKITSGGKITVALDISVGHGTTGTGDATRYPNNNNITVQGTGSLLSSGGALLVGNSGTGNSLTVESGSLAKANALNVKDGNLLQLNGGYLALKIDQSAADTLLSTLLGAGKIQVWDEISWVTASENSIIATYYATSDDAFAAIGYEGLGGYTVFTTAIPEPGTVGLLMVGLGGLAFRLRKKAV